MYSNYYYLFAKIEGAVLKMVFVLSCELYRCGLEKD
jgi:hypothetical protein